MKNLMKIVLTLLVCIILVGCGNTEKEETNNNTNNINDETKVTTIAESYAKYSELKSQMFEKLSDSIPDNNSMLPLTLLGFASMDFIMVPITMCGVKESEAAIFYSMYNDLKYTSNDNECTITYSVEGKTNKFISLYDRNTDSVQTKFYEDNKLIMISEYIKLDDGYGSQQYMLDDDFGNSTSFRSIFRNEYIAVGFFENVTFEPTSLFKNKNLVNTEWTKGGSNWSEYDNGEFQTIPNE